MEKIICIFGDSISWGASDIESGGWVQRLKKYSENKNFYNPMIYNLGIPGDDTNSLLFRIENELAVRRPNIIIFATAINDSAFIGDEKNSRVGEEKFIQNWEKILEKAKFFSREIIFLGPTEVDESKSISGLAESYSNKNILKYNNLLKNFVENNNFDFLDLQGVLENGDLEDGIHSNSKGHKKIFDEVKKFLEKKNII